MRNFPSEKWLFWLYYPLVSISINLIGQENSFVNLVRIPSFYSDLLLAFILSYSVGYFLNYIWRIQQSIHLASSKFIKKSLFLGLVIPFLVCVACEIIYLIWLLEIPLGDSPIFVLDSPLIFIFLSISNLFYLGRYLFENQKSEFEAKSENLKTIKDSKETKFITVSQSNKKINVSLNDILYLIFEREIVFLVLENGSKIPSPTTLKAISEKLPASLFFQVNRQLIVTRKAIQSYKPADLRRLSLKISDKPQEEFIIPKAKVREFKAWFGD